MRHALPYALAAKALEPGEALALRRAAHDPTFAARLAAAQAQVEPSGQRPSGPWFAGRGASLGELHLDAGPWRAGDRLPVVLDASLPPDAPFEAVLHTRSGAQSLSPVEGRHLRLAELRRAEDGRFHLDLVLGEEEGLHRLELRVLSPDRGEILARAEIAVRIPSERDPAVE